MVECTRFFLSILIVTQNCEIGPDAFLFGTPNCCLWRTASGDSFSGKCTVILEESILIRDESMPTDRDTVSVRGILRESARLTVRYHGDEYNTVRYIVR